MAAQGGESEAGCEGLVTLYQYRSARQDWYWPACTTIIDIKQCTKVNLHRLQPAPHVFIFFKFTYIL